MNMKQSRRVTAGFTLIELLVVIAIIAVLASILFPVFATAREKARASTCLNNQRQIAAAVNIYIQDNNNTVFPDPISQPWNSYLATTLTAKTLDCPSSPKVRGTMAQPSYGINPYLYGKALGSVSSPSTCLLTADINASASGSCSFTDYNALLDPRHTNSVVLSCVDGHITTVLMKNLSPTLWTGALLGAGINPYLVGDLLVNQPTEQTLLATNNATQNHTWIQQPAVVIPDNACPYTNNGQTVMPDVLLQSDVKAYRTGNNGQEIASVNYYQSSAVTRTVGWYHGLDLDTWGTAGSPNRIFSGPTLVDESTNYLTKDGTAAGSYQVVVGGYYTFTTLVQQVGTAYQATSYVTLGSQYIGSRTGTFTPVIGNNLASFSEYCYNAQNYGQQVYAKNISVRLLKSR